MQDHLKQRGRDWHSALWEHRGDGTLSYSSLFDVGMLGKTWPIWGGARDSSQLLDKVPRLLARSLWVNVSG